MSASVDDFDAELQHLLQSGEDIVLIEMSAAFLERLLEARGEAAQARMSEDGEYRGIRVFLSEDAEDYQFHLAMDDDAFEWGPEPVQ